jgi:hypothetical protein
MEALVNFSWIPYFRRDGCVTEKVIANIVAKLGSVDELDGLDTLRYIPRVILNHSEEDQKSIKEAVERGSSVSY